MTKVQVLGAALLAAPFIVLTAYMLSQDWRAALLAWAILVVVCVCVLGGVYFLKLQ